jgi:hypothetical protein
MTNAMLRRLERLEQRRPRGQPWRDDSPWLIPHLMAVIEGRPHSILPSPERELSLEAKEASEQAFRRTTAELDRVAARLEQEDPGGAARFQAEVERKRAAIMRQLEPIPFI